jgi:hypothetical protein
MSEQEREPGSPAEEEPAVPETAGEAPAPEVRAAGWDLPPETPELPPAQPEHLLPPLAATEYTVGERVFPIVWAGMLLAVCIVGIARAANAIH